MFILTTRDYNAFWNLLRRTLQDHQKQNITAMHNDYMYFDLTTNDIHCIKLKHTLITLHRNFVVVTQNRRKPKSQQLLSQTEDTTYTCTVYLCSACKGMAARCATEAFSTTCAGCYEGWQLPNGRSSLGRHYQLKPGAMGLISLVPSVCTRLSPSLNEARVWSRVTANFFTFLYFCLMLSKMSLYLLRSDTRHSWHLSHVSNNQFHKREDMRSLE